MKAKENRQRKSSIKGNMLKQSKGITLIALIVTIIIMLILAGVTINVTLGDNGLFSKSKEAVERHKEEAAREKISMAIGEYVLDINSRQMTEEEKENHLKEILSNVGKTSVASDDKYYEIEVDGHIFWVDRQSQEIISKGKTNATEEKPEPEPKEVTSISLNPTTLIVNIGEIASETIEVTYEPEEAEGKTVTWESNNTDIATVANGVVTGLAGGTTIITATTPNGKTATCTVTVKDEEATTKRVGDITITPKYDYGKVVTGYNCKTSGITWRLWYVDNVSTSDKLQDTVYLIGDFITTAQAPTKTVNGITYTVIGGENEYCSYFATSATDTKTGIMPAYANASKWIWDNQTSISSRWLSQWFTYGTHKTTGDNNGIKAVAYLIDSELWTGAFGDSANKANYVLGGPTMEMYCASYKDSHPNKYLESKVSGDIGYYIKWNTEDNDSWSTIKSYVDVEANDRIYSPGSNDLPRGMWICAPSASSGNPFFFTNGWSIDQYDARYRKIGFCPVVCLKPGVQIVPDGDGFRIQ